MRRSSIQLAEYALRHQRNRWLLLDAQRATWDCSLEPAKYPARNGGRFHGPTVQRVRRRVRALHVACVETFFW